MYILLICNFPFTPIIILVQFSQPFACLSSSKICASTFQVLYAECSRMCIPGKSTGIFIQSTQKLFNMRDSPLRRSLREPVPVVRCGVVHRLTHRDNTGGVDRRMTTIVVILNMVHIDSPTDTWNLKQLLGVIEQIGILTNQLLVRLEVNKVNLIKPDERHEQANISFSQLISSNVLLLGQNLLTLVQRCKELVERFLVRLLLGGEPTTVHAVVDRIVSPTVYLFNAGFQMLRVEIHLGMLRYLVELVVEHFGDLRAFIVDDPVSSAIPQDRHGVLASVASACNFVKLSNRFGTVEGIHGCAGDVVFFLLGKHPAMMIVDAGFGGFPLGLRHRDADGVLQSLELQKGETPRGPGTCVGNVKVVPTCFRWELGSGLARDEVPERGFLSLELAVVAHLMQRRFRHGRGSEGKISARFLQRLGS